ncbi:MAG: hypothetical protein WBC91_13775 [Phototrophicaceae bacterium]
MRQRTIHPKWVAAVKNQPMNWFLYCTGKYTDEGQQDILYQLAIERRHLAWWATLAGYVEIADPVHNVAIIYPQLNPYAHYSYPEKDILKYTFQLRYGNGVNIVGAALYFLQLAMNKECQQDKRNADIWTIGKDALIAKDVTITS